MNALWDSAAATDTGLIRESNEDRYWIDAEHGVFLVVDGVGGRDAGEVAAQTAVDTIRTHIAGEGTAETRIRRAIAAANDRIFELARGSGMACVLTLALVEEDTVTIGHVGDSRLYLIWNGAIRKLTSDHSPVGEGEDSGELSEAEAMMHPRRHEVFRDVGSRRRRPDEAGFIEIRQCRFRPDAALLLASDGLTDHLTASQIREIVDRYEGDSARIARALVEAANAAGGRDNITVLFVAGPEFRGHSATTRPRTGTTRILRRNIFTARAAFLVYGLLLAALLWALSRGRF
jgi:serine/threonine protein phosphatase PrpC